MLLKHLFIYGVKIPRKMLTMQPHDGGVNILVQCIKVSVRYALQVVNTFLSYDVD